MTDPLGRLERVDLRAIWATEAQDFTPWLAQERNLSILGDTIGMELELEAKEKDVGPFRADILCRDTVDGDWVLIENQLEKTDHPHLGQLLTYAAGLEAVTIVWIAASFTEEHRAALDWLNEITDDRFQFFGLEVELWRISGSPAAPKFNIISKPNDWSRSVSQAARRIAAEPTTEVQAAQLQYWTEFREYIVRNRPSLQPKKAIPDNYMNFGINGRECVLSANTNSYKKRLRVELYLDGKNAKARFHKLMQERSEIESTIGAPLSWEELPQKRVSRIAIYLENTDPMDYGHWPDHMAWMADMLEKFDGAFRQRIKPLEASGGLDPEDNEEDASE